MDIKATDVKALREKTGAGMMDCKKALAEAGGDSAKAERLLKEWGLAGIEKRAGRATNEGRVFIAAEGPRCAIVEIACETDFVARNEGFIKSGETVAALVLSKSLSSITPELEDLVKDIAIKIKENIALKRVHSIQAGPNEKLETYIHGDGKIGVVVRAASSDRAKLEDPAAKAFFHDIALHIAAFNPAFLDKTKIVPEYIAEQESIFKKQVEGDEKMKGKPAKVIEGILKGKLAKHLSEICLVDQGFVKDEKQTVGKVLQDLGKTLGASFSIADYIYFRVGES